MSRSSALVRQARLARDLGLILTAAAAGVHQGLVGNWVGAAIAAVVPAAGITLWRTFPERSDQGVAPLYLVLGLLLVWGFRESLLWLSITGALTLVATVDLDRLVRRFPVGSSPAAQRAVWLTHLFHLLVVGILTALFSLSAVAITLRLQLLAVMLLTLFVVLSLIQIVRSIHQGQPEAPPDEEAEQSPPGQ